MARSMVVVAWWFVVCALVVGLGINEFFVFGVRRADHATGTYKRMRSVSRQRASLVRVVESAVELCESFLDECWLDSGTLLGARREGRVLKWDEDGDLGVSKASFLQLRALHKSRNRNLTEFLTTRSIRLTFTDSPVDVVARVVDVETQLYVDYFVYFRSKRGRPPETPFSAKLRPSLSPAEVARYKDGPGLVHGVFSRAWTTTCERCKTRAKDDRKCVVVRDDWVFPLVGCTIEGVRARCPKKTDKYLAYMYGDDFLTPPVAKWASARLALYLTVAAAAFGAFRVWLFFCSPKMTRPTGTIVL